MQDIIFTLYTTFERWFTIMLAFVNDEWQAFHDRLVFNDDLAGELSETDRRGKQDFGRGRSGSADVGFPLKKSFSIIPYRLG